MTDPAMKDDLPSSPPADRILWYPVGLLFLLNVLNYADRSIMGVLIEPIKADLRLSDTDIGFLTGFAFAIFYAVAGLFVARLADLYSRKTVISVSVITWSFATALTGMASSFWQLFAIRTAVGVGEAGLIPSGNAILADLHRPSRRPLVLAIFTGGSTFGLMAGAMLGGAAAEAWGWRIAFLVAALPGIPLAILTMITLQEPKRPLSRCAERQAATGYGEALRSLLGNRVAILLMLGLGLATYLLFGLLTWFPAYLSRMFGVGPAAAGQAFGLALGIGTLIGAFLGGGLANRLAQRDLSWLIRLPLFAIVALVPMLQGAIFAPSLTAALVMTCLVVAISGACFGPILAAVQTVVPREMRATAAALGGFSASLFGVGGAPLAVGIMSDWMSGWMSAASALQAALSIAALAGTPAILVLWLAGRAFARSAAAAPIDKSNFVGGGNG